jgi:hypothetical protein
MEIKLRSSNEINATVNKTIANKCYRKQNQESVTSRQNIVMSLKTRKVETPQDWKQYE